MTKSVSHDYFFPLLMISTCLLCPVGDMPIVFGPLMTCCVDILAMLVSSRSPESLGVFIGLRIVIGGLGITGTIRRKFRWPFFLQHSSSRSRKGTYDGN